MSEPQSLFEPVDDGAWLPTGLARGPWSPDALHGGPVAALLAGAAEAAGDGDADGVAMHPARLTVELLRPVPLAPLRIRTEMVRPGRKVQLVDAEVRTADGTSVATARLLRIRAKDVAAAPVTTTGLEPPKGPEGLPASRPLPGDLPAFHSRRRHHGLALAESRLWDEQGPVGRSLQSLLVDDRAPGGAP